MTSGHFKTRREVVEFIHHEGGLQAALEYGITEKDMPQDDRELRSAWYFLRVAFELAQRHADYVTHVLEVPKGSLLTLPEDLPTRIPDLRE